MLEHYERCVDTQNVTGPYTSINWKANFNFIQISSWSIMFQAYLSYSWVLHNHQSYAESMELSSKWNFQVFTGMTLFLAHRAALEYWPLTNKIEFQKIMFSGFGQRCWAPLVIPSAIGIVIFYILGASSVFCLARKRKKDSTLGRLFVKTYNAWTHST